MRDRNDLVEITDLLLGSGGKLCRVSLQIVALSASMKHLSISVEFPHGCVVPGVPDSGSREIPVGHLDTSIAHLLLRALVAHSQTAPSDVVTTFIEVINAHLEKITHVKLSLPNSSGEKKPAILFVLYLDDPSIEAITDVYVGDVIAAFVVALFHIAWLSSSNWTRLSERTIW